MAAEVAAPKTEPPKPEKKPKADRQEAAPVAVAKPASPAKVPAAASAETPSRLQSKRPTLGSLVVPAKEEPNRNVVLEERVRELEVALFTAQEKSAEQSAQLEQAQKANRALQREASLLRAQASEQTSGAAFASSTSEREMQSQIKKLTQQNVQQQNLNKIMAGKLLALEKTANDERKKRQEVEAQLSAQSAGAPSSVQRQLNDVKARVSTQLK